MRGRRGRGSGSAKGILLTFLLQMVGFPPLAMPPISAEIMGSWAKGRAGYQHLGATHPLVTSIGNLFGLLSPGIHTAGTGLKAGCRH